MKKIKLAYPSISQESVTTKANESKKKGPPSGWLSLPVYGHPFSVQLYNMYIKVRSQIESKQDPISMGNYNLSQAVLLSVSEALEAASMNTIQAVDRVQCSIPAGRGQQCNKELQACEIGWTGVCSHELQTLLRGGTHNTILIHQSPTRNQSGTPETLDWALSRYQVGCVGEIIAGGDGKIHDLSLAIKTTEFHMQNSIVLGNEVTNWPVRLGFSSTPRDSCLSLHFAVPRGMWKIEVVHSQLWNPQFLATLYYGVCCLLDTRITDQYCLVTETPLTCNMPQIGFVPLKHKKTHQNEIRIFKDGPRVYKYFNSKEKMLRPNCDVLIAYSNLSNVQLQDVTLDGRITRLGYDYIDGDHNPTALHQFVGVVETLQKLHDVGLVHSDVRLSNMIFTPTDSYLIDYDLTDVEGALYPSIYSKVVERHKQANAFEPRAKIHDRFSVAYVMDACLPDIPELTAIVEMLKNANCVLIDVITLLVTTSPSMCH